MIVCGDGFLLRRVIKPLTQPIEQEQFTIRGDRPHTEHGVVCRLLLRDSQICRHEYLALLTLDPFDALRSAQLVVGGLFDKGAKPLLLELAAFTWHRPLLEKSSIGHRTVFHLGYVDDMLRELFRPKQFTIPCPPVLPEEGPIDS